MTSIPDEGDAERAGWESGVVGALSYMLKIKREEVKATIDAERIKYLRINTFIGVCFAGAFAFLAAWAFRAERQSTRNRLLTEEKNKRLEYMESVQSSILKLSERMVAGYKGQI